MTFAHFAVDFHFGSKSRNRVDNYDIHCAASYKRFANIECLLAVIGLRNIQFGNIYSKMRRINGVESMFGVNKRNVSARFLRFGYYMQRQRSFTAGFRPEYFNNSASRQTAYSKRHINSNATG